MDNEKLIEEIKILTKRFMESGNDTYRDSLILSLSEAVEKLLTHKSINE